MDFLTLVFFVLVVIPVGVVLWAYVIMLIRDLL